MITLLAELDKNISVVSPWNFKKILIWAFTHTIQDRVDWYYTLILGRSGWKWHFDPKQST